MLKPLKRLPEGHSYYDTMYVTFISKMEGDSPDRRIIYAFTEKGLVYIPSALLLAVVDLAGDWYYGLIQPYLPVWTYSNWAESKCEAGVKYKLTSGKMPIADVVPRSYWS